MRQTGDLIIYNNIEYELWFIDNENNTYHLINNDGGICIEKEIID